MKRITLIVTDSQVNLAKLLEAVELVHDFHVETIDAPEPQALAPKSRRKRRRAAKTLQDAVVPRTIMAHFTPAGTFRNTDATAWVAASNSGSPSSTSSYLTALVRRGFLSRPSRGHYRFEKPFPSSAKITPRSKENA